jgi:hypothetical protein
VQRQAVHQVCVRVARVGFHRAPNHREGLLRRVGSQERAGQPDAAVGVQRVDPHGFAERVQRLVVSPRAPVGLAQEEPPFGTHRIEVAAALERAERGRRVAGALVGLRHGRTRILRRGGALDELLPGRGLLDGLVQPGVDAREAVRVDLLRREVLHQGTGGRERRVPLRGDERVAARHDPGLHVGLARGSPRGAWQQRPGKQPRHDDG